MRTIDYLYIPRRADVKYLRYLINHLQQTGPSYLRLKTSFVYQYLYHDFYAQGPGSIQYSMELYTGSDVLLQQVTPLQFLEHFI